MVLDVAFTPDGKHLVFADHDTAARLWSTESFEEVRRFEGHLRSITSVAISSDGSLLASTSLDSTLKLWDLATGKLKVSIPAAMGRTNSVAFAKDGSWLARLDMTNGISLYDLGKMREGIQIIGSAAPPLALALTVSPNNRLVAAAYGNEVKVWELPDGELHTVHSHHFKMVRSLAFSPDSKLLASGGDDSAVILWDLKEGKVRRKRDCAKEAPNNIRALTFAPDGGTLAVLGGRICFLNVATGDLSAFEQSHRGDILAGAFSPNGKLLATGATDHCVKLWKVPR